MKYENLCNRIVELVGGKDNVEAVVHCATRLRFTLKNRELADQDAIKAMDEVIDVVSNKVSFQIIIGTEVASIHPELLQVLGLNDSVEVEKQNIVKRILDLLSESITPILPAMMAACLFTGVLSIFTMSGLLSEESSTYIIFDSIRVAMFYFLPVFMAISASKRLGAPIYLGVLLAVTLLSAPINGVEGLELFGFDLPAITYSNSFLPILLGLWFMGQVNKIIVKYIPKSLDYFFTPLLTMLITLPVTLMLFGPIGTWLSDGLGYIFQFIGDTFGSWLVLTIYAACQPFLIMLGAGNFIIPIALNSYATLGHDAMFTPAWIISDMAVCGAMFGYFLRAKDQKQKQFFGTVSFSAFMGITEPAVFGAFIKYRRPFMAVIIGGGLGGLVAGLLNVKGYSMVGLFGIGTFIDKNGYSNFYFMIGALVVAFIVAAIAGFLLWIPKDSDVKAENEEISTGSSMNKIRIATPIKGKVIPLAQVKDNAFSTGALGKGLGIIPEDATVTAPIAGEVVSLFPTNHAIGIRSEDGVEILVHIGIDTVELEGKGFEVFVKQGDKVSAGQPLIRMDLDFIKKEGYDSTVIVVVTNTNDYLDVVANTNMDIDNLQELITVIM
ncbi:PTS system beta-glucosides-specific IIC component [Breznakia sp. PF5-3]|uniref:beta-glucoside-specific PTS transporter subunit IIABC n=1 Tax=unclassified Breznakia TaxID=2623764 RepID=UPI0024076D46|nr:MULTISPECIES: beta-glucoside-specific PTS transporter subunit IIABC [unclassified Breznakia]MDF9825070.1 PTS system beta-glucosides-specific IIC component [Breznakia sp. PM6-1]MDF9835917.1 PTS system beta-glucosides-specific IIC component [Breznakia sp. PF5-3]MDF9837378.1 PTS system beta-glucosides-specific IIC component [Breznakia sp. PFB2-8]MDF9859313.1 PTS system beta-glucosides-specific IIC component [Breznakia sp. PH5-24]